MSKKIKIASIFLATSLIVTPISNVVLQNHNVAKAEEINKQQSNVNNIQKHIEYIDNQIYLENNELKINKDVVLNYIKNNWNDINKNNQFNSPEEYCANIELTIQNMNEKVNSGWYEINNEKAIISKYQSREWINGYERYEKWWGFQYYARGSSGEQLARDFEDAGEKRVWGMTALAGVALFSGGIGIPVLGLFTGFTSSQYYSIANKVRRCISDYGTVKVSVYVSGSYYTVEPIQ